MTGTTLRERIAKVASGFLLLATLTLTANAEVLIAVIIDDLGDNQRKGRRALALPGEVTLAVLPHTRWGQDLAQGSPAAARGHPAPPHGKSCQDTTRT